MRPILTRAAVAVLGTALGLSACTNSRQDITVLSAAKALWTMGRAEAPVPPDERIVALEIDRALAANGGPLALMRIEGNAGVAVLRPIERNGAHTTWTTWGRTERRSITTKKGVVTATRGLGGDLMSSDVDRLLAMVTGVRDGIDRQVLRHLDGENVIRETVADCAFTPAGGVDYAKGAIRQQAIRVDVFCKTDGGRFSNHYIVSPRGRILESHQWLGPDLGHGTFQQLR